MNFGAALLVYGGMAALIFFLCSAFSTKQERYSLGLAFGVLELLSAVVSSFVWAEALWESGKIDWFLFGILNYPLIGLIFWSMLVAGVLCVVASIRGIKQKKAAGQA